MNNSSLRLILSDLRGSGNVGSILRTSDACDVEMVYACGYTPYPALPNDDRPPHVISSNTRTIAKTALGAEQTMRVRHFDDIADAIADAKAAGYTILAVEQAQTSSDVFSFIPAQRARLALILGNEVTGLDLQTLNMVDDVLEIPMLGRKESLGVAVATGIVLYQLRFGSAKNRF